MHKYIIALIGIIALGTQVGCSTIINGTTQDVAVSSDPAGARVEVDGSVHGVTPISVNLERKNNHLITISLDGYQTEQVAVNKVMSGAVAGNILAGGLIGWGIDAASGAQYKLKPDIIAVVLRPGTTNPNDLYSSFDEITPADRLRELSDLNMEGLLTDEEYEVMRKAIVEEMKAK